MKVIQGNSRVFETPPGGPPINLPKSSAKECKSPCFQGNIHFFAARFCVVFSPNNTRFMPDFHQRQFVNNSQSGNTICQGSPHLGAHRAPLQKTAAQQRGPTRKEHDPSALRFDAARRKEQTAVRGLTRPACQLLPHRLKQLYLRAFLREGFGEAGDATIAAFDDVFVHGGVIGHGILAVVTGHAKGFAGQAGGRAPCRPADR